MRKCQRDGDFRPQGVKVTEVGRCVKDSLVWGVGVRTKNEGVGTPTVGLDIVVESKRGSRCRHIG